MAFSAELAVTTESRSVSPRDGAVSPQDGAVSPQGAVSPLYGAVSPQGAVSPLDGTVSHQDGADYVRGIATTLRGMAATLRGIAASLHGVAAAPRYSGAEPERGGAETDGAISPHESRADRDGEPEFSRLTDHVVLRTMRAPLEQWAIASHGVRGLWQSCGTKGAGARVAVIDTGVNTSHPDLRGVAAHDYTGDGPEDRDGHGTHCCGIVGASDSGGVCGVSPGCELHSFRVFNDAGVCRNSWIIGALRDIRSGRYGRFDVVSMSLGAQQPSEEMRMILMEMSAMGVVVLAAAGNDGAPEGDAGGAGTVDYPAAFMSTIAVGSTDRRRARSGFSSTGNKLVVTGPGQEITSCWVGPDAYATISGTSMACPFVAGCVALLVSYARAKGLPPPRLDGVMYCLAASAVDIDRPGYDFNTGFGDVNPAGLLQAYERLCARR